MTEKEVYGMECRHQVELEGQGEVTFVACASDPGAEETADAVFWLERDGEMQSRGCWNI